MDKELTTEKTDVVTEKTTPKAKSAPKKPATRKVWNISNNKIELDINGKAVSIAPKQTIEVPEDFVIPLNIGLIER
jgi:hypothetical protein